MVHSVANKMSREKSFSRRCQALLGAGFLLLLFNFPALGNPTGGTVTQGSATFNSSGSTFNINQSSANAFINWQSFNIGLGETVNFNQPTAQSVTFNQINDVNPSQILGNLNANGYVVLENANGFYIGGQAVFDVHGLILTTATPAVNFADGGPWSFDAPPPTAQIQNYGQINITAGGSAFLIAADIVNGGTINAPNGHIGLYDGETVLVSTSPNGEGLSAQVTLPQGSVDNEGNLTANGGSVVAQAQFVNQNGVIQANSVQNVNGTIELLGGSSVTLGANSSISATGDSTAANPSAGGSVTVRAGDTFSDEPGSVINVAGATQGGNGGQVEISAPQMGAINTVVNGQAQNGYSGGTLTIDPSDIWLTTGDSDPLAPAGYSIIDVNSYNGLSQINIEADDDIALNTIWSLTSLGTPSILNLTAGNDITLEPGAELFAGQGWTVNLIAGTGFIPTAAQPTPASGSDGIYLENNSIQNSLIQGYDGNINLWAANEVQVGWAGVFAGPGQVNGGSCSITTTGGGNINVTTIYGDVNTGSNPNGFDYNDTALDFVPDGNLGGISTAAGGNVTITAGGDVISYLSSDSRDAGTGAFGTEAGNVTITAGGSVYGHYVVTDGIGTITAGQNAGGSVSSENLALSLSSGGWSVNAPNGSIYLQEVRNPNGVFNDVQPGKRGSAHYIHLFTYNPDAYVDLTANAVYLNASDAPGLNQNSSILPVLYPPILNINAGSGGVTLGYDVTLFPSPDQNLVITTTGGGNLTAIVNLGNPYQLLMSDSAATQWTANAFTATDHGTLANEPTESSPVFIDVSGSMENVSLTTTKVTDINVGGDMIDCSFSGQNLQASDITSINVAGQIYNTSPYTFVTLSQGIATIPSADLLLGMGSLWSDIFTLAINPTSLAKYDQQDLPNSTAIAILESAGMFPEQFLTGQFTGINPGFVYNPTVGSFGRLGFTGQMDQNTVDQLSGPITVLKLVNGLPVWNATSTTSGYFETTTVTWADQADLQTLHDQSQGKPPLSTVQPGYVIGGPGQFDITAGAISLGDSDGIISSGIYDPSADRYANLESITPVGATVNVTITGPDQPTDPGQPVGPNNPLVPSLDMLTSAIASFDGGNVNVISTSGSMDLGSPELTSSTGGTSAKEVTGSHLAFGIYTTGGGDVSVIADGDVDIDGSRIATYDGGDIFVESMTGNVNIGSGSSDLNTVESVYSGEAFQSPYGEDVFGSGIVANTLVPALSGGAFPPDAATVPGNITVETPNGNVTANSAGILQEALDGTITAGPQVLVEAGTPYNDDWTPYLAGQKPSQPPIDVGNIELGKSGVIGGDVILLATGNIIGDDIYARQNATITAQQTVNVVLVAGGGADVAGQNIEGTIAAGGDVNIAGDSTGATLLSQNVSQNGVSSDTLGTSATATAATQSAAQTASSQSQQQVAADTTTQTDDKKKKPQIQKVSHVTVLLSAAVSGSSGE